MFVILGFPTRSVVLASKPVDRKRAFPLTPLKQYKKVVDTKMPFFGRL